MSISVAQAVASFHAIDPGIQRRCFCPDAQFELTQDEIKTLNRVQGACDVQSLTLQARDMLHMLWTALENDQWPPDLHSVSGAVYGIQELVELIAQADFVDKGATYYIHRHELGKARNKNAVSGANTHGVEDCTSNRRESSHHDKV